MPRPKLKPRQAVYPFLSLSEAPKNSARRKFAARERETLVAIVRDNPDGWTARRNGETTPVDGSEVLERVRTNQYDYAFREISRCVVVVHCWYYYELRK